MNKKEVIDGLIGNAASGWKETDREFLMGLPDERLKTIATNAAAKPAAAPAAPAANAEPAKAPKAEDVLNNEQLEALSYGKRMLAENKAKLVATIIANKANKFTEAVLNGKSLDELEGIAALAAPVAAPVAPATPWFGGQAAPAPANNAEEEAPLALPTMNFETPSK